MLKRYVRPVPLSLLWFFKAHHLATPLDSLHNACSNNVFVLELLRDEDRRLHWENVCMYKCVRTHVTLSEARSRWRRASLNVLVCVCRVHSQDEKQGWCMLGFWLRISSREIPSVVAPCRGPEATSHTHTLLLCSLSKYARTHPGVQHKR